MSRDKGVFWSDTSKHCLWCFPNSVNTPLLCMFFFSHGNPYSPHRTGTRVAISTSHLHNIKIDTFWASPPKAFHLFPYQCPLFSHPEHQLLDATHDIFHLKQISRGRVKRNHVTQENLSSVSWNLVCKKKRWNVEMLLKIESFLYETISPRLTMERMFSTTNKVYILYIRFAVHILTRSNSDKIIYKMFYHLQIIIFKAAVNWSSEYVRSFLFLNIIFH